MKTQKGIYRTVVFLSLLLSGILVLGGSQVSAEKWTDAQKEVWKTIETLWEYIKAGDVKAMMALGHEGHLEWWSGQESPRSGDQLEAIYHGWLEYDKPLSYELKPINIRIIDNVATVFLQFKWKGNMLSENARQLVTLIKQNNKWKVINAMPCRCNKLPKCQ